MANDDIIGLRYPKKLVHTGIKGLGDEVDGLPYMKMGKGEPPHILKAKRHRDIKDKNKHKIGI